MSHYGREHGYGGFQGDYSQGGRQQGGFGGRGDYQSGGRSRFGGSSQDDHYHSWRQRQMDALDRDYADYCREREQRFHQDFDSWRQTRQQSQGSQMGGGQEAGGMSGGGEGALDLSASDRLDATSGMSTDAPQEPQATVDTDSAATLGQGNEKVGRNR
jgi:hypothetical protein